MIKDVYLNNGNMMVVNLYVVNFQQQKKIFLHFLATVCYREKRKCENLGGAWNLQSKIKYWVLRVLNTSMIKYEYEYVKYEHEYDKVGNMRREESKER